MTDRDAVVHAAAALLMAAILLRDMGGAMPRTALESMPADIRNRMFATYYQSSFERLPADVREEARAMVLSDPDLIEARRIDAEGWKHD